MAEIRLTNNTHEASFGEILKGDKYYRIPPFQRAYKWNKQRIDQLIVDVNRVKDEDEAHFLGAFIIDALASDPNAPSNFEVIDGQQRITTFYLLICAVVRTLLRDGQVELACEYALNFLFTREGTNRLRTSLVPSIPDQGDLNAVIDDLWESGLKSGLSAYRIEKLPQTQQENGRIPKNLDAFKKYFATIVRREGIDGLKRFVTAAQTGLTVVQILVKDPTDGPKIFDSLNSKQEPMTTGDLVRNEIFSKVAHVDPRRAQELDNNLWQPFYASFKHEGRETFEGFFFPFGLIQDSGFKKSEVYNGLRKVWDTLSPEDVMNQLEAYRVEYQDLIFGENRCGLAPGAAQAVLRLARFDFPKVALPFLMRVSHAIRTSELDPSQGEELLSTVEAFLVRRALCSVEPTGLHTVFKKLWTQLGSEFTKAKIVDVIRQAKTVTVPTDEDVRASFDRPLYGKNVAKFFLFEFDRALGGDPGNFANLWIEHVLPQSFHEPYWQQFSRQEHAELVDLAGNLLPLSQEMNRELGQESYATKAPIYEADSSFKSARVFARDHQGWDRAKLLARNQELADWSVIRWRF